VGRSGRMRGHPQTFRRRPPQPASSKFGETFLVILSPRRSEPSKLLSSPAGQAGDEGSTQP
jgi:hypothetical protein